MEQLRADKAQAGQFSPASSGYPHKRARTDSRSSRFHGPARFDHATVLPTLRPSGNPKGNAFVVPNPTRRRIQIWSAELTAGNALSAAFVLLRPQRRDVGNDIQYLFLTHVSDNRFHQLRPASVSRALLHVVELPRHIARRASGDSGHRP